MSARLRAHLERVTDELARSISHPAYLERVRDIHNAPSDKQYELAEQTTLGWARDQGVPVSRSLRSVPRTFENPEFARKNGVQSPGIEPGAQDGAAPAESFDTSSWRSGTGYDIMAGIPDPEQVAGAVRKEMSAIIDFVVSQPFQLLLGELRFTPHEDRPQFVLDVILNKEEREARGVYVPKNMLVKRSTFHDGRPTLFCVSALTQLAKPWRKLTVTFDNETIDP